jgi:hypothetical protein
MGHSEICAEPAVCGMIGSNYKNKYFTGKTDMSTHKDIGELRLEGMTDLCVVRDGPPPFSFQRDLNLQPQPLAPKIAHHSAQIDTMTYWGPK